MTAQDKARDLVDTYRIILMNTDTDCGEEILCTVIAKKCALNTVEEILNELDLQNHLLRDYWYDVQYEIERL